MADSSWRDSPPTSAQGSSGSVLKASNQFVSMATNGVHGTSAQPSAFNGTGGVHQQPRKFPPSVAGRNGSGFPIPCTSQPMKASSSLGSLTRPASESYLRGEGGQTMPPGSAPLSRGQGQSPFANVGATGVPARMASPPLASGFGLTSHVPGSGPPSARSVGGMGGGSGPVASSVGRPLSMGPPRSVGGMGGSGPVASSVGRPLSMTRSYSPPLPPANAFGTTAINNQTRQPPRVNASPLTAPSAAGTGWSAYGARQLAPAPPQNGYGYGEGQAYPAPPKYPPSSQQPPRSANGAPAIGGLVVGGGRLSRLGSAPTMSMYDAQYPGQQHQGGYSAGTSRAPVPPSRRGIDPQQIPRPVVHREGTTYRTCTPPSVRLPPPPTSRFVALDEGNCSPRFIRSTVAQLPATSEAVKACKIPMAVVIQPMALVGPGEAPVTVVDFGESGPLRCDMCRAYMNSFAKFSQNGEKWVCNFCKHEGPVPQSYQCPLDSSGLRRDRHQRAELSQGSVDFAVPKAIYSLRPEQEPIFVFCVDASPRAMETGFTLSCLSAVEAALEEDAVPGGERARVGLMTFDGSLHAYKFDDEGAISHMLVAADTEEPYAPLPASQWMLSLDAARSSLPGLIEAIPVLVPGRRQKSSASACASGAALRAVADCLAEIGGRVVLMAQSPGDTGAGKVGAGREDPGLYGGEKEFGMYQPAEDVHKDPTTAAAGVFYRALAKDCASRQICVDVMLWSSQAVSLRQFYDVGSVGMVSRVTGGRVTYLRDADAGSVETSEHLREQLSGALRDHAHSANEAILKVRCSTGMACTQRLGPGIENMPGELEVVNLSPHDALVCRLEHDGQKIEEGALVFIQVALLYTSTSGQRRVRCHTLGLPATGLLPNLFRSVDVETVSAVMTRQAVSKALHNSVSLRHVLKEADESMLALFSGYRKRCAPESAQGQLVLPETLPVLPLYMLCARKIVTLRPNTQGSPPNVRADERAARLLSANTMSITDLVQVLYPSLYSVHDLSPDFGHAPPHPPEGEAEGRFEREGQGVEGIWGRPRPGVDVPEALSPTSQNLMSEGVFLLDAGEELLMYVGRTVSAEVMNELFGVEVPAVGLSSSGYGNGAARLRLREDEGCEQARRVRNVIAHLRRGCAVFKPLVIAVANSGSPEEARFVSLMVEDKTRHGISYVEELMTLYRKVQAKMS